MSLSRQATIYLATKMRGVPGYNAPLFADYAAQIRAAGFTVLSPPELDAELTEIEEPPTKRDIRRLLANSLGHLLDEADALCLLPGWRDSRGVAAEIALARAIDLPIVVWEPARFGNRGYFRFFQDDEPDGPVLLEALQLVSGERNRAYGDAYQDFSRVARASEALLGLSVTAEQVALLLIIVKLSRAGYRSKFDNARDIAGYAECLARVIFAKNLQATYLRDDVHAAKDSDHAD